MAAELASHREKHETLLQRLLAEQRARLERAAAGTAIKHT